MATTETGKVRVGGRLVPADLAARWVDTYLNHLDGVYAYPYYDFLDVGSMPDEIRDGDLLATTLLNASLSIEAFADLREHRDVLEERLAALPVYSRLEEATNDDLIGIGALYGILDRHRIRGVRGTTLSKVLHRKRPNLVPLYDEYVRRCYQDGPAAPLPPQPGRSWADFMTLLAAAIRADLQAHAETWDQLRRLGPDEPVASLRALDIVAWRAGQSEGE